MKIRLLLADDHPIFLEGLSNLLDREPDLECVGLGRDGEEAVLLAKELLPDVAILDIAMPKLDGIEAAKQIKVVSPKTVVLILSAYRYKQYCVACLKAGLEGYILKDTPRSDLISIIRLLHGGNHVFNLGINNVSWQQLTTGGGRTGLGQLNPRELEILDLLAAGLSNKQISRKLNISTHTVETHIINLFRKIGVQSRLEAVVHALKEGWLLLNKVPGKEQT